MAAEQGRTQWNGRSDAAARDPRSAPCTSLKVHKPNASAIKLSLIPFLWQMWRVCVCLSVCGDQYNYITKLQQLPNKSLLQACC